MKRLVLLFVLSTFIFIQLSGFCSKPIEENSNLDSIPNFTRSKITTTRSNNTTRDIEHYTTYDELSFILQEIAWGNKSIVKLYDNLGTTHEDRTIWMMKISDNPEEDEDSEAEVLFVGAHHGNEAIANEMAIFIIETFTAGYGIDPRITWMVDNHEIWVIPMPNPDGFEYTYTDSSWRKNRSPNYPEDVNSGPIDPYLISTSNGTDLNRNYDYYWGDPDGPSVYMQRSPTYAGSEPFSELETQAIRDIVLDHDFSVYMDYHSGIEMILYPWGYTSDPTEDNVLYERTAETMSRLTGYQARQGYDLYQTNGDSIDWIYLVSQTLAFTVELSQPRMPEYNTIQSILDNHIKLPLYLTGISGDLETGSQIKINQGLLKNQTTSGPFMITEMVDGIPPGSDLEVKIYYTFNDNDYKIVKMHNTADQPNIYTGKIPKQKSAGVIRYFISVENEDIMVTLPESNDEFEFNIKGPSDDLTWPLGLFLIAIIIIIVVLIAVILKTIRRKNY